MKEYIHSLASEQKRGAWASFLKGILFILSLIYGLVIRSLILLNQARKRRLSSKMISVGNITLGGTGKTTIVEFIASLLRDKGRKPAILTRGYKRKKSGNSDFEKMGDEPAMLKSALKDIPVIVDKNRCKAAGEAIEEFQAETLILDDGFQQWGILKDLEIVAIDASNPFGNKNMIPRGILREPLSSLKRADIFVLTKCPDEKGLDGIKSELKKFNKSALIVDSRHKPESFFYLDRPDQPLGLEHIKNKNIASLSGIGDPDSFLRILKELKPSAITVFNFPDHYCYSPKDLKKISEECVKSNISLIVTTEKDAVRLKDLGYNDYPVSFLTLRVRLDIINNYEEFIARLLSIYNI